MPDTLGWEEGGRGEEHHTRLISVGVTICTRHIMEGATIPDSSACWTPYQTDLGWRKHTRLISVGGTIPGRSRQGTPYQTQTHQRGGYNTRQTWAGAPYQTDLGGGTIPDSSAWGSQYILDTSWRGAPYQTHQRGDTIPDRSGQGHHTRFISMGVTIYTRHIREGGCHARHITVGVTIPDRPWRVSP